MTPPSPALARHAAARDDLLARVTLDLEADPRVAAAWLAGSFGRGDADAWSDLDLHVAVADEHYLAFWAERVGFYERFGRPILIQPEIPANTGIPGGGFQLVLYPGPCGPIEVDWSVGPAGTAVRPQASRLLVDRIAVPLAPPPGPPAYSAEERRIRLDAAATFFWAMAPIAVKYAARGETARAVSQASLLTDAYATIRHLVTQCDPELASPELALGRTIDPTAVLALVAALCAEAERLSPALVALGATVWDAMPEHTAALVGIAAGSVPGAGVDPGPHR